MFLPLEDVRVLDFSQRLPGPYCTSVLADLGADVIMVERPSSPSESRGVFQGLFELLNKNKKSITLNLKTSEGKEVAKKLIEKSDVLVEGFRPGVADRLGIGYASAHKVNPVIIYCSISGFGQNGPYKERVGHDINFLSLSGVLSIPGQPGSPISRPGIPIVDLASGLFAAVSILGALKKKEVTKRGEWIDVSMFDSIFSWMAVRASKYLVFGGKIEDDHLSPLNNIYLTKDGKRISIGIIEQHFWEKFCEAVSENRLLSDPRFATSKKRKENSDELMRIIEKIIKRYTLEELDSILDWREIPYSPVLKREEAINDLHVQARKILQEIEGDNKKKFRLVPFPVKFSETEIKIRKPAPTLGQDTEEILKAIGYSEKELNIFKKKGIID